MTRHTTRKSRARKTAQPRHPRGGSPDPAAYQTAEQGGYFGTKLPHQKPVKFHKRKVKHPLSLVKATRPTATHHPATHHKARIIPTYGSLPVSGGGSTWQHKHPVAVDLHVAPHRHPNTKP